MSDREGGVGSIVNGNDVECNRVGDGGSAIADGVVEVGDAVEVGIGIECEVGIGVKGDGAVGGGEASDLKVVDIFDTSRADVWIGHTSEELCSSEVVGGVLCAVGEGDGINRKDWRVVEAKDVDVDGFADEFRCRDDVSVSIN